MVKKLIAVLLTLCAACALQGQSLIISGNSQLIMRGNVSLVIRNAALINNGTLVDSAGTVQFSGSKDTSFSYLGGSAHTSLYNLSINKENFGTAVKSKLAVQHVLGVYNGILYPDSNVTLRSDKNLTARVDAIPAGADIKGKAIVERYFPRRRAWRLVTAPLTQTTSIFDTWQNKGVYEPGVNTFVTGPNPTGAGGNGLDASPQNNPSMKTWNVNTQSLDPVVNTHAALSKGNAGQADNTGYFLFVRGDRDVNNFTLPNCTNTTLSSNGQLQVGTQNFVASSTGGGYTLIGNPYASPVDFNAVSRTNLVKRFYIWDPFLNIVGGYVMLDDLDNDGVFTKSINASAQTNHIQSGQAFFIETQANGAAMLGFQEAAKSAGNNNAVFRPSSAGALQSIRIMLHLPEPDTVIAADGVLFEGSDLFSKNVDRDDALKFGNINETMSLMRNGYALAAERSGRLTDKDTLFIKMQRSSARRYQLQVTCAGIDDPLLSAWLEDSYLHTKQQVDLHSSSVFEFIIDSNAASAGANRFRIVFQQLTVLPVTLLSVNAVLQQAAVRVTWDVANEINIRSYEVEKSSDGFNFSMLQQVAATGSGSTQYHYGITDTEPFPGYNYYRVKYMDDAGNIYYSNVVTVRNSETAPPAVTVYPNPVKNNVIYVQLQHHPAGNYTAAVINEGGQRMYETGFVVNSSNTKIMVQPSVKLAAGSYLLRISNGSSVTTQKIIVQ